MPKRRFRRRRHFKNRGGKRGKNVGLRQIGRSLGQIRYAFTPTVRLPIPLQMMVPFTMRTAFIIPNAIGVSNGYIQVQMNNLFNPFSLASGVVNVSNAAITHSNGAVNGDNPNCFLNYCSATTLYKYYRVLSNKIVVKSMGVDGNAVQGLRVAIAPTQSILATFASFKNSSQAPYAKVAAKIPIIYQPINITNKASIHTIMGVPKYTVKSEDGYAALYNAAPTNSPSWQVDFITTNDAAPINDTHIEIDMTWLVRLEQPNYVGSSD